MSRATYTAVCERTGDWWVVQVDPGPRQHVVTQVRRLGQIEATARDAIALLLDVAPDSFDVLLDVRLPGSVRQLIDRATELRHEAALVSEAAAQAMTEAARALLGGGLTMREAGQVLGLSHQRVLQLVHRAPATA
jgi:hypothetical protein